MLIQERRRGMNERKKLFFANFNETSRSSLTEAIALMSLAG
jgi:hypothetical protein